MVYIDVSLSNKVLWKDCEVLNVCGENKLVTPVEVAVNILGRNLNSMFTGERFQEHKDLPSVILCGSMAVWAYMIVFHAVIPHFRQVYYYDGSNTPLLIASAG